MNELRKKVDLFKHLDRPDIDIRLVDFVALWYASGSAEGDLPNLSNLVNAAAADIGDRYFVIDRIDSDGPDGHTYRYRELGAQHPLHWRTDLTGRTIEQIFPAERLSLIREMYDSVLTMGQPHYWRIESSIPEAANTEFERVIVPVLDADGKEVLLGVTYWAEENQDDSAAGVRTDTPPEAAPRPTENLEIRLEIEGAPLTVENIVSSEAIADEDVFREALSPMLRKLRSGLSVNFGRISGGMLRLVEGRLDVQVAASLSLLPVDDEARFLAAMAPYVEAFRSGIVHAAIKLESQPGEQRRWRARPRFQSFIGFRLQRAYQCLSRQTADLLQDKIGITLPELRIIATLGQDGMQTVSDAAVKTMMDRAQVSRTLAKLQEAGFVDKFVDRHDRRVSWLSLTEAGEELWETMYPVLRERDEQITKNLSADDLRIFYRVLDALAQAADDDIGLKLRRLSTS